MNRNLLLLLCSILACLVLISGCKKEEEAAAPAADEKVAEAAAPAADEAKAPSEDEIKKAVADVNALITALDKIANEAGDDCAKLGQDLNAALEANQEAYSAANELLESLTDSAADSIKDDVTKIDSLMSDDAALKKALDKCNADENVKKFTSALIDAMMND